MRTIELRKNGEFEERLQILAILKSAPVFGDPREGMSGYTFDEVRDCLKVIDKLEAMPSDGPLILEDAEWQTLKNRVAKVRWNIASREIVEMVEKINDAKKDAEPAGGKPPKKSKA